VPLKVFSYPRSLVRPHQRLVTQRQHHVSILALRLLMFRIRHSTDPLRLVIFLARYILWHSFPFLLFALLKCVLFSLDSVPSTKAVASRVFKAPAYSSTIEAEVPHNLKVVLVLLNSLVLNKVLIKHFPKPIINHLGLSLQDVFKAVRLCFKIWDLKDFTRLISSYALSPVRRSIKKLT